MYNKKLSTIDNMKIEEGNINQLLNVRRLVADESIDLEKLAKKVDKKYSDEQQEIILQSFKTFCSENDIDYKKRDRVGNVLFKVYGRMIKYRVENLRVYHLLNIGKNRILRNMGVGPNSLTSFQLALREYNLSLSKPLSDEELIYFERLSHNNPYSKINK